MGREIGRLRHFKSPDDWFRDDGNNTGVCSPVNTRATFGFSSSVCVSKGRQKQKKKKKKVHWKKK